VGLLLLASLVPLPAQGDGGLAGLLRAADDALFSSQVRILLQMDKYQDGKPLNSATLECWCSGASRFLAVYRSPEVKRGGGELRVDDTIYTYVAKVDRLSLLTSRQAYLYSLFNSEDLMCGRLAAQYDLAAAAESQSGGRAFTILSLKAKTKDASYGEIRLSLDTNTRIQMRRAYYSFTGQLLKELVIDRVIETPNGITGLEMTMRDAVRTNQMVRAKVELVDHAPIPETWFSVDNLKKVAVAATKG
jgi:hypothetical protein